MGPAYLRTTLTYRRFENIHLTGYNLEPEGTSRHSLVGKYVVVTKSSCEHPFKDMAWWDNDTIKTELWVAPSTDTAAQCFHPFWHNFPLEDLLSINTLAHKICTECKLSKHIYCLSFPVFLEGGSELKGRLCSRLTVCIVVDCILRLTFFCVSVAVAEAVSQAQEPKGRNQNCLLQNSSSSGLGLRSSTGMKVCLPSKLENVSKNYSITYWFL